MPTQRTVLITFKGSVSGLLSSTKSATASIAKLGAGVVGIGKALGSALGGNFKPIINNVLGAITTFAKVLLLMPGFLLALVNPVNVAQMAMANFATAVSASSPAEFVGATRNMAPAMKDAVMAVRLLHPQLKNLYGIIQQGFWLGFTDDINNLARVYFPVLGTGLGTIAGWLGKLRHELVKFFLQPAVIDAITSWMAAFGGLGSRMLQLSQDMMPTMIVMFTAFASILTNFVVPAISLVAGWFANILGFIAPILAGIGQITSATAGITGGSGSGGGGGGFFSNLLAGVGGFFSHLFGGGMAAGGSVMGGQSYLVGEKGPEILTMGGKGYITPNSGGGATYVTVKIGETELRELVSTEIDTYTEDVAVGTRMGRGLVV